MSSFEKNEPNFPKLIVLDIYSIHTENQQQGRCTYVSFSSFWVRISPLGRRRRIVCPTSMTWVVGLELVEGPSETSICFVTLSMAEYDQEQVAGNWRKARMQLVRKFMRSENSAQDPIGIIIELLHFMGANITITSTSFVCLRVAHSNL